MASKNAVSGSKHGRNDAGGAPKGENSLAGRADRHKLYERAVQAVDFDLEFLDTTFSELRGRRARLLREDFCGTASMCCEWVRHRKKNRAIGVDIDREVLEWGRRNNIGRLPPSAAQQITLIQDNVLEVRTEPADIVLAFNFSYQLLKERKTLGRYFSLVRDALVEDGLFVIDAYGGHDAQQEIREKRTCKGFTYIWDQASYDPISGFMRCHIHFKFPDGSRIKRAFSYEWRLWTLPELCDLLEESGFSRVTVYWEGTDEETGEGNGIYRPAHEAQADPCWICYLIAEK